MTKHILLGILLIVVTSIIHLIATKISLFIFKKSKKYSIKRQRMWNLLWLDVIVIMMILAQF
jgi:hypothetical protein